MRKPFGEQRPSFSRGRRCLYCQQQGCPGIHSCWWPRVRHSTVGSDLREMGAELNRCVCSCGGKSALEENLRAQMRVLECEVQMLRSKSGGIAATVFPCKKLDASTMTPDLYMSSGRPSLVKPIEAPSSAMDTTPSSFMECRQQQGAHKASSVCSTQEQKVSDAAVAHTVNLAPSPFVQEMPIGKKRVEGLEHLVRELATKNAELCRNLAETMAVLEQRDKVLRALFGEKSGVGDPSLAASQNVSPLPSQMEFSTIIAQQLMQTQEEVAHLREEIRQTKSVLVSSEARLKCSEAEVAELRPKTEGLSPLPKESKDVPHALDATNESTSHAPSVDDAAHPKLSSALVSVSKEEVHVLYERLASTERKLLAWETWYLQQKEQRSSQKHESEKREEIPPPSPPPPPHRNTNTTATASATPDFSPGERLSPVTAKQTQEEEWLLAAPSGSSTRCVGFPSFSQWRNDSATDALVIDTYALIEREAALRKAAAQERNYLMAELVGGVHGSG